jgi:CHAT domain-containing protein/Tfp pilus assembly protein PilF
VPSLIEMSARGLAVFSLILAACGTPPEVRYQNGRRLLKEGKLDQAMSEAEAGMRADPSWRFRILKADVLLRRYDAKAADALLSGGTPPSDPELLARLRMDQGVAENLQSNYSKAEELLQQALRIVSPLNLPSLQSAIEMSLGNVQVKQGRLELGERTLRHVIEVTGAEHDLNQQAVAMSNLGYRFLNAFQMEEAIYWFDKARLTFQQLGLVDRYYIALGNLASSYQRLGDFDQALAKYQEAEEHAKLIGDTYSEQHWVGNSGEVLSDRGDLQAAASKFRQALAIAKSRDKDEKDLTSWWYYNLASLSIELGDFAAAEEYNREALRLRQTIANDSDYYPRVNEAYIAAGRNDPRAEGLFRGLIAQYHEGMSPVQMLEAEAGLARLLADKGDFEQADAQFRVALTHLESRRTALASADNRMTYLASLIRFYDRYINFLMERKQPERALEVAESSRARVLDERLESKSDRPVVRATELRALARSSHAVFLSYWLGKKRSFLWAVTGDGITPYELPAESQIAPLVSGYRSFIENLRDPLQSEYPAGAKLSEILLRPAREVLASTKRVVLVPDRALHSLNFETLPDPDNPSKYFIERTTMEVAPSLNMLASRRPAAVSGDSLLLIGDPEQAVEEYPRLPFAGSEIKLISQAAAPRKEMVIEGSRAFPAAYRDAQPARFAWIHFAAHAAANRTSPLDSALILSRHDNGYQLSAREVMNVPLNASLVTLSACRSAGAKTYSGEGQVGLSWAFLRAGSRSVVAGLWDVTDRSTAALMADFYDQLAHDAAPVDALRHAKLQLLHGGKVYQKPFYWGPFQLYAGAI